MPGEAAGSGNTPVWRHGLHRCSCGVQHAGLNITIAAVTDQADDDQAPSPRTGWCVPFSLFIPGSGCSLGSYQRNASIKLPTKIGTPTLATWNAQNDLLALARTRPDRETVARLLHRFHA